jgi:beta-glucosidase
MVRSASTRIVTEAIRWSSSSYTNFTYSALRITPGRDGGIDVGFTLTNAGAVASDEVPQVYLGAPIRAPEAAQFAVRSLVGFDRIRLERQQSRRVRLHVDARGLQY